MFESRRGDARIETSDKEGREEGNGRAKREGERKKTLLIKRGEGRWKIMRVASGADEEECIRGLPLSASRR